MRSLRYLFISLLLYSGAFADVVHLRNGERIEGTVIRNDDTVTVLLHDGTEIAFAAGEIDRIEKGAPAVEPIEVEPFIEQTNSYADIEATFRKLRQASDQELTRAAYEFKTTGERAVPGLVHILKSNNPQDKALAAAILGRIASSTANDALAGALNDPDENVRTEAAKALGAIGSQADQAALVDALDDPKAGVRRAAADALVRINDALSIPFLLNALKDPDVRDRVAGGLLKSKNPCIVAFLWPFVSCRDAEVKQIALRLLAETAAPCQTAMLLTLLEEEDASITRAATRALSRLRSHKQYSVPTSIEIVVSGADAMRQSALAFLETVSDEEFDTDTAAWHRWWTWTIPQRIYLVPFGHVSRELMTRAAAAIQSQYKVPTAPWPGTLSVRSSSAVDARHYNGDVFLDALEELSHKRPDALRFVGITGADLALPGRGYFFSPYRPGGPVVISTRRIRGNVETTCRRVVVQALHAVGYSLLLPACGNVECPLSDVFIAEDLDAKRPRLCEQCARRAAVAVAAERALAGWNPRAPALFEQMSVWNRSPSLLKRAAIVNEMWRRHGVAAVLWRHLLKSGTDQRLKGLITKRLELTAS